MRRAGVVAVLGAVCCVGAWGQAGGSRGITAGEARVEAALARAKGNEPELRALLRRVPKGGDLHMHFSGAVYGETLISDGVEDGLCVDRAVPTFVKSVGTTRSLPGQPVCPAGDVPAAEAIKEQGLYDGLIDSFSMRTFVPVSGRSGHDHFFETFDRYDPGHSAGSVHGGEWLDEIVTRAAAQNEQYVELMHTPDLGRVFALSAKVEWPVAPVVTAAYGQVVTGTTDAELEKVRRTMVDSAEFGQALTADEAEFARVLRERGERERCGTAEAAAGCGVGVRWQFHVLRAMPPAVVFAESLVGFALAEREIERDGSAAAVVAVNFVQPEDNRVAMAEYSRQMRMVRFLHRAYPRVRISLHAGELTGGLVATEGLRFHIRQAVEVAGAERIGHGVDVSYEDDAEGLLAEMRRRGVMVEVNLTSNDVILNVKRAAHPLRMYLDAGVPVSLSTDDEGVSRIDITHEWVRGVEEQGLRYVDLKRMARVSLEHSFLPGPGLWEVASGDSGEGYGRRAAACRVEGEMCARYRAGSPKAAAEWELERRFGQLERDMGGAGGGEVKAAER